MNADPALKFVQLISVYVYIACVISRNSNDGLRFKKDLNRQTKLNMDALVENFIFLGCIG